MDDKNYIREVAGRIRSLISDSDLPDNGLDDLFQTYAVLALSKGTAVTNEDVHDAWSAWATKYDPHNKSLKPFNELSADKQAEDSKFTNAIRRVASEI